MNYTLKNPAYEDKLIKQVVHMDQAVCYCPEFRATKMMHDYPSRKLQMAFSVNRGDLEPDETIANLLFQSLLSRQGERWQNFGECPEDCTDAMILSREMILKKGFGHAIVDEFKARLSENNGHLYSIPEKNMQRFERYIPVSDQSTTYLLIDDATANFVSESARNIGEFFDHIGVDFYPEIEATFAGFEYFAYGLVEEGKAHVEKMLNDLASKGIDTIVTLTGQAEYLLSTYIKKLDIDHEFKIVNILDCTDHLHVEQPSYLYAGSFYTRYLRMEDDINRLVKNTSEKVIANCAEFNPLLEGDQRVNKVTIWQKPISAEYCLIGFDQKILDAIVDDCLGSIKQGTQQITVAFDPYDYQVLSEKLGKNSVVYFADLL